MELEEPEIRSTDPKFPIDNNCQDEKLHFVIPGGSGDYEDEGDETDECDAIPSALGRVWAETEILRFELGTTDVDGIEGDDGDDADADEE